MKKIFASLLAAIMLTVSALSYAAVATTKPNPETPKTPVDAKQTALLHASLHNARPKIPLGDVRAAAIPGLFEVDVAGSDTLYMSADGKYLISGTMFRIDGDKLVNIDEERLRPLRAAKLAAVKNEDMVIFSPSGKPKAHIYVFTDVDCGYCHKLQGEVAQLNAMGIEVRYLAFPRAGVPSSSAEKMSTIWCASDRKATFAKVIDGESVPDKTCKNNPIAAQYKLGSELDVNGTPAMFKADGTLFPGYMPAAKIAEELGVSTAAAPALLSAPAQ